MVVVVGGGGTRAHGVSTECQSKLGMREDGGQLGASISTVVVVVVGRSGAGGAKGLTLLFGEGSEAPNLWFHVQDVL